MKKIYFDCTNGISGDMAFAALLGLLRDDAALIEPALVELTQHLNAHEHAHSHDHFHRSYREIKHMIAECGIHDTAREKALAIYAVIAKAEAFVHETTLEEVHFHEVGRDEAIRNIVGIALCMEQLDAEEVYCSAIHDGTGFIDCSHGRVPVPVPAVMAMRKDCVYTFVTDEVETEMVTPSGLAVLMGLGAICCKEIPEGRVLKETVVFGKRRIGREGGMKVCLIETQE